VLNKLKTELDRLKNPVKAAIYQRFFKTGKGEYGEGDVFLGITVPEQRKIAREYLALPLNDVGKMLSSKIHEYRVVALMILSAKFRSSDEKGKGKITKFYLHNLAGVNNWDLVDGSAPTILGEYLLKRNRAILYKMALSKNLWERRVAVMATFAFTKEGQFDDTIEIAKILLSDKHDLIHKAVGWMLREIGKKDETVLKHFLDENCTKKPRTMLRYAIEKFEEGERKAYLKRS